MKTVAYLVTTDVLRGSQTVEVFEISTLNLGWEWRKSSSDELDVLAACSRSDR